MLNKILISLLIIVLISILIMPVVSSRMADEAFNRPEENSSIEALKQAIQIDMSLKCYGRIRPICEKAVIYFPESSQLDFFIFSAALSAEKEGAAPAAAYWYKRFADRFPEHKQTKTALEAYNKNSQERGNL